MNYSTFTMLCVCGILAIAVAPLCCTEHKENVTLKNDNTNNVSSVQEISMIPIEKINKNSKIPMTETSYLVATRSFIEACVGENKEYEHVTACSCLSVYFISNVRKQHPVFEQDIDTTNVIPTKSQVYKCLASAQKRSKL